MNLTPLAKELLLVAKRLMAGGTVSISDKFISETKAKIQKQIDGLQDSADENKKTRSNAFELERFERAAQNAIKQARPDVQPALEKEFHEVVSKVQAIFKNPDEDAASDLVDWLWDRSIYYRKNDTWESTGPNYSPYQKVLRDFEKVVDAFSRTAMDDLAVKESEAYYHDRLSKTLELIKHFANKLEPIARDLNMDLEVSGNISEESLTALEEVKLPTLYVKIKGTDLEVTVFVDGAKNEVDDVIDDPDFFQKPEDQINYDGLVHFLRTGQLPKEKPVKFMRLYRAMSSVEMMKWHQGEAIPIGKFFTSKSTGAFAYDDPNLEKKIKEDPNFSYGLESFSVRSDCVAERDVSIYITIRECVLKNNKIIPA